MTDDAVSNVVLSVIAGALFLVLGLFLLGPGERQAAPHSVEQGPAASVRKG